MGMGIDDVEETNCKVFVHFLCMFVYTNVVFLRLFCFGKEPCSTVYMVARLVWVDAELRLRTQLNPGPNLIRLDMTTRTQPKLVG